MVWAANASHLFVLQRTSSVKLRLPAFEHLSVLAKLGLKHKHLAHVCLQNGRGTAGGVCFQAGFPLVPWNKVVLSVCRKLTKPVSLLQA